jgi:hypothetical protein
LPSVVGNSGVSGLSRSFRDFEVFIQNLHVTATEATKAGGGALGMRLVIGSEAVEDIGEAGKCSEQKS